MDATEAISGPNLIELLGLGYTIFWGLSAIAIIFLAKVLCRSGEDRELFAANLRTLLFLGFAVWAIGLVGAEWARLQHKSMIATLPNSGFDPSMIAFYEAVNSARLLLAHCLLAVTSIVCALATFARRRNNPTG